MGFDIERENLPLTRSATIDDAISEGEDYELLFAVSPRDRTRLGREWRKKFRKLPLTRIGRLNPQSARSSPAVAGNLQLKRGYVHFQQSG